MCIRDSIQQGQHASPPNTTNHIALVSQFLSVESPDIAHGDYVWVMDSGATTHMVNSATGMFNVKYVKTENPHRK